MKYALHISLLACALLILLGGMGIAASAAGRIALAIAVLILLAISWLAGLSMREGKRTPSTNLGFYLYLLLGFWVKIFEYYGKGENPPIFMHTLVLVPLVATCAYSLLRRKGAVVATQWVSFLVGGCWIGFALVSHGLSLGGLIEASPFLLMLAPAFLVKRWPRITGVLLIIVAAAALAMFGEGWYRDGLWQLLLLGSLMPFPLLAMGVMLFIHGDRKESL